MKTNSKSLFYQDRILGKICRYGLLLGSLFFIIVGCSSMRSKQSGYAMDSKTEDGKVRDTTVPEEFSLKEDRSYLDQLRSDVPEDVKQNNDELAFIMKMMGEVSEKPERIRDRFASEMRKRRDRFNKLNQKEREAYNNKERKDREAFLKEMNEKRDKFVKGKPDAEDRKDFFNDQETKRREYFANQSDNRRDFESKLRERTSDFEAYVREKQNDFNQEHRAYSDRFRQFEKDKKDFDQSKKKYEAEQRAKGIIPGVTPSTPQAQAAQAPSAGSVPEAQKYQYDKDLAEFEQIPKTKADKLKSGDDGK